MWRVVTSCGSYYYFLSWLDLQLRWKIKKNNISAVDVNILQATKQYKIFITLVLHYD